VRYAAPRMGRPRRHKTVVNSQAVDSKPGIVSRLENSLSIASGAAGSLGDLPKNCHLLPSTAILELQNRYTRLNRFNRVLGPWSLVTGPRSSFLTAA
jgi:hypothetical protein